MTEKAVIARNTLANAGATLLQLAASFVFMPLLISGFGLVNYGVFLLASSVSVYLSLLDFGVSPTVTKYAAEYRARDQRSELAHLVSNAVAYYAVVGIAIAGLLLLFARYGVWIFRLSPADTSLARVLFTVSAGIALFVWPLSVGGSLLAGLQRYDLSARVGAWIVVGNIVATAAVLIADRGPVALLAALGVVSIAGAAVMCLLAYREVRPLTLSMRLVNRSTLGTIFGFSWALFVIQLATIAGDQQTDRLVLGVFSGAAAVAVYESVAKLSGVVSIAVGLPTAALVPAASQMNAEARPEALRALYLRGTKYTVAFVLPIAVGLIVLARPLLLNWLGPAFAANSISAQAFLLIWLVFPNLAVALTIFIGTGRLRFLVLFTSAHALLNLALTLALVRPFGVLGVVLGTVITEFVLFPIGMWYALKTLRVSLSEYTRRVVMPTYPLLVVSALVAWGFTAFGLTNSIVGVAIAGLASVSAYWVAVFFFGLASDERGDVSALVGSVTRWLRVGRAGAESMDSPEAAGDPTANAVSGDPLVSVLTPSYNQAAWLPDNLRSVTCQTYPNLEHIVMDGGSTDGSIEVLRAAGESVSWRSEPDKGQADAINKAFRESRGEIVGWINSDDAYFDCNVVADVVAYFATHANVDVVYGHSLQTTADGSAIQVLWTPKFDSELQKAVNLLTQPAVFMRRSVLSDPMLDASFHFALDYELWLRLTSQGRRFGRIDRILAIDRHQPGRKSSTIKDVHDADLRLLDAMYGLHLSPVYESLRRRFWRTQRVMGALHIPSIRSDAVAFTAPANLKAGLWRRQIGSRRTNWPGELK